MRRKCPFHVWECTASLLQMWWLPSLLYEEKLRALAAAFKDNFLMSQFCGLVAASFAFKYIAVHRNTTVASRIWSHEWCLSAGKDPTSCSPVDLIVSSYSKRWRWGIRDAIHSPPEETITLAWLSFSSFDVHIPKRRSTVLTLTKSLSGRRKYSHLF